MRGRLSGGRIIVAVALAVLAVAALSVYADADELRSRLAAFRWELFPLALVLTTVNYLLRFWRWQLYLAAAEIEVPAARSLSIFTAGLSMTLSPAKVGEVVKSALLKRAFGIPIGRSMPLVFVERLTDALGITILAVVAGALFGPVWLLALVVVAGSVAAVGVLHVPLPQRLVLLAEAQGVARVLVRARLLVAGTAIAAIAWLFECFAAWVIVRGLGADIGFREVVIAFTVSSLAGALSFLPGGLGVAEGSMTGLFRVFDLGRADAVAATLLIRLATLWYAVVLGVIGLLVEARLRGRG